MTEGISLGPWHRRKNHWSDDIQVSDEAASQASIKAFEDIFSIPFPRMTKEEKAASKAALRAFEKAFGQSTHEK